MAETNSQAIVGKLQSRYGTYSRGQLQSQRKQFWSFIDYANGNSQYTFFGSALGDTATPNLQKTNMPVQGSFGTSSFLLKTIRMALYIPAPGINYAAATTTYLTDATSALWADLTDGFAQAGLLKFTVGAKDFVTIPKPFLYAPPADGRSELFISNASVTEAAGAITTASFNAPEADLNRQAENVYNVDPELYIDFQENFRVSLEFPAGAVTRIGTTSLPSAAGNLFVGVVLDGVEFRPVQ
jgi:hypothetical protein